jgi:hypothetical protein
MVNLILSCRLFARQSPNERGAMNPTSTPTTITRGVYLPAFGKPLAFTAGVRPSSNSATVSPEASGAIT